MLLAHSDPLDVSRPELYRDDLWQSPFEYLRAHSPVHHVENSAFGPYWSVSTYRHIVEVESQPSLYSSEIGNFTISKLAPEAERTPMFIGRDPPIHTAQRRTVAPAFSPAEMRRLSGDLRQRTAELLDALPRGTSFDWVERVSTELTTQMLAILFDFPWGDRAKLGEWSDWMGNIEMLKDPALRAQRMAKVQEAAAYFQQIWNAKLGREPTPDLISLMTHSDAMNEMDAREFMGTLILLIVGGNDTTRNSMSGLIHALNLFPEEWDKLRRDGSLIPNAVSEIIRWQTPLEHMARTATRDTTLAEQQIREGDKVVLWYISANRDEAVFGPDPDAFRVDRENARRHLAFGHGIHRCVGARLAELQLNILLEEMVARGMKVALTGTPIRIPACFVHGYQRLPVEVCSSG